MPATYDPRPIGVFDSGLGGLTTVRELFRVLPQESVVYFGDTARLPYGTKSRDTVTRFSLEIASFLVRQNIKCLIVACNTSSSYALDALSTVQGLRIFGPAVPVDRGGTISFELGGIHPHDVGQVLDSLGIQVRVGHHCARPTCVRFGVPAMTRVSFYLYNTTDEVDALVRGLEQVRKVFS